MALYDSIQAIRHAEDDGLIDWHAAADAAKASTDRGRLTDSPEQQAIYRDAVIEARDGIEATVDRSITLPSTIEILDRHHWVDRSIDTFARTLDPTLSQVPSVSITRQINTASTALTLAVLAKRVVGQFDPAFFGTVDDEGLYLVEPNLRRVVDELEVDQELFTRWVIHHEVSHVAEFSMAPWLREYLEEHIRAVLQSVLNQSIDRQRMRELQLTMTVVEGFAELLMDEVIEDDIDHLRDRLDAHRAAPGPVAQLIDWVFGITAKRQQYEQGHAFFEAIAQSHGLEATLAVWSEPAALPDRQELDDPARWVARVHS